MSGGEFELIYEGPADDSADTLRRIKKTLVGELSFSIEETKEFLEKTPATLFTADDEHSLDEYYHILKKAGARVYVVRPRGSKKSNETEFEISLDLGEEKKQTKVFDVSEEAILEENLPIYEPMEEEHYEVNKDSKAFVISDEDTSLENLMSGLAEDENEYILPTVEEEEIKSEVVVVSENPPEEFKTKIDDNPFSFDDPKETKTEIKNEEAKDALVTKDQVEKPESLEFSFDSTPNTPQPKLVEEIKTEPAPVDSGNTFGFDLTFADEAPVTLKTDNPSESEPNESKPPQKWDLSLDVPKESAKPDLEQTSQPVETKKSKDVDDILNDYNPNEESEGNEEAKKSEVVVPPLAEVLLSKKVSTPIEEPKESKSESASKKEIKKNDTRDIYYIALAGTILLWICNHWYFTNVKQDSIPTEQEEVIKPKKERKELVAAPEKTVLVGIQKDESGEMEVSVLEQQGKILQISVSFKGMESAPLTPEQIVNGYKKRPWIEQIRFDPADLETDIDGAIKVSGPARISINDDSEVKRLIGTGDLKAKLTGKSITVKFDALYGTKQLNPGASVKRTENGLLVSVSVDTTIALNPKSS